MRGLSLGLGFGSGQAGAAEEAPFVAIPLLLTQGTSGVFWTGTPPLIVYVGEVGAAWQYPLSVPGGSGGGSGGGGSGGGGGGTVPSVSPLTISASPEAPFDTLIVYTMEDA